MVRTLDIKKANSEILDFLVSKGFIENEKSYKNFSKIKIVINENRPIEVKIKYSTAGIFTSERTIAKEHLSKKE